MSNKTYRSYTPRQSELLPSSPLEWLPEDHLVYAVLGLVAQLDLRAIHAEYEREARGFPPYHPRMMVGLLVYSYCVGVPSSRRIERKTHEDVAFRVITGGQHPDHSSISEFRKRFGAQLEGLAVQVLALCMKAGLVKLGHVAVDGTKVKPRASKDKAKSYERMKKQEVEELRQKVKDLLRAESRLARIRAAKAELEAEARQQQEEEARQKKAAEQKDNDSEPPPPQLPSHRVPREKDGTPAPKAQRNFTDADSRIMKTGDGYVQGYNCQAAVDEENQSIVAQALTTNRPMWSTSLRCWTASSRAAAPHPRR